VLQLVETRELSGSAAQVPSKRAREVDRVHTGRGGNLGNGKLITVAIAQQLDCPLEPPRG
jgi:hypothetical protein